MKGIQNYHMGHKGITVKYKKKKQTNKKYYPVGTFPKINIGAVIVW